MIEQGRAAIPHKTLRDGGPEVVLYEGAYTTVSARLDGDGLFLVVYTGVEPGGYYRGSTHIPVRLERDDRAIERELHDLSAKLTMVRRVLDGLDP